MTRKAGFTKSDQARIKAQIIKLLSQVHVVTAVCQKVNITPKTFYKWKKEDSKFAQQTDEAVRESVDIISSQAKINIIQAIKNGNLSASKMWLSVHDPAFSKNKYQKNTEPDQSFEKIDQAKIRQAINLSNPTQNAKRGKNSK